MDGSRIHAPLFSRVLDPQASIKAHKSLRRPRIPNWVAAKSQYRAIVVNSMVALGLQFNGNFFNQQSSNV